jgi:hypothetical protein
MEFGHEFRRVYVVCICPGVVFSVVAFPLDQILELASEHAAIQYFLHNIFFFAVDELGRRRRRRAASRNGVVRCGSEFDDIEHGVETTHRARKAKTICVSADARFYHIWSETAMRELLGRSRGSNIAGVEVYLVSNLELGCWRASLVIVARHVVLGLGECCLCFLERGLHARGEFIDGF